jgi:hypothetical protein
MTTINGHIEDYLDYYCDLKYPPKYAVLLKGPWGAGKTWFVKKYSERLKEKSQKYLYVSLYGLSTFDEIEDAFFHQLHPLLSSKGMAIAGKVLKGVIRASLKIDLDSDKKEGLTIVSQFPDLKLPDYLKNTEGCILIFDDLERCALNIEKILGYINHFVEHQGLKIISLSVLSHKPILQLFCLENTAKAFFKMFLSCLTFSNCLRSPFISASSGVTRPFPTKALSPLAKNLLLHR